LIPAIDGKATLKLRRISLGSVSGTVLDRSGHPISGAKLDLSIAGRQEFVGDLREMTWLNNTTGPDGTFKYPSIYPGTPVVVMVHAEGFADGQSSGCHIVGGKDTKIPPIRLWPGKVVSGRVVDRQGNPVEGASVWIEKILKVSENVVHTDKDGRFRYTRVPLGKHTLWISNKTRAETFPITNDSGATYTLTPWQLFKGN